MVLPPILIELQQKVDANAQEIKKIEQEYQKVLQGKKSMTEKKNENEMVMQELNLIENGESATVYKLVGPVLAKQDLDEAKTNVKTRLEYIQKEIDRMEHLEKEFMGKCEDLRKQIMGYQNKFREEAMKMKAAVES